MNDDLRHLPDDSFQKIDEGDAFVLIVCIIGAAYALYRVGLWS